MLSVRRLDARLRARRAYGFGAGRRPLDHGKPRAPDRRHQTHISAGRRRRARRQRNRGFRLCRRCGCDPCLVLRRRHQVKADRTRLRRSFGQHQVRYPLYGCAVACRQPAACRQKRASGRLQHLSANGRHSATRRRCHTRVSWQTQRRRRPQYHAGPRLHPSRSARSDAGDQRLSLPQC